MSSVCLSLHVHQPFVLRRYSVFDSDGQYFDAYKSRDACQRFAGRSIIPVNRTLHGLIRRLEGRFRLSIGVSGSALDLFERFSPEVIDSFRELAKTGCVEFLAVPYYNSLSFLYSSAAFVEQVTALRRRVVELFGQEPRVFRNSEWIHGDELIEILAEMGLDGVLCDGVPEILETRSCNRVYGGGQEGMPVLLRNARLSRDVSQRFCDQQWDQWPLTAPRYAEWLGRFKEPEELVVLAWDYGTFGLIMRQDTGILEFLRFLPEQVLSIPWINFVTASEAIERHAVAGEYRPPHYVSAAETDHNLSAWLGNPMQSHATHRLFALESGVRESGEPKLLEDWRRLQACEYVEAMSTGGREPRRHGGWLAVADSPYDAYINFMNICDSVESRLGTAVSK